MLNNLFSFLGNFTTELNKIPYFLQTFVNHSDFFYRTGSCPKKCLRLRFFLEIFFLTRTCTLFNMYINKITQEFKIVIKKGIQLNNRKLVNTILYADDQILVATSDDDLQTMAYHLKLIARKYKMNISSKKQNQWQCGGTTYSG